MKKSKLSQALDFWLGLALCISAGPFFYVLLWLLHQVVKGK